MIFFHSQKFFVERKSLSLPEFYPRRAFTDILWECILKTRFILFALIVYSLTYGCSGGYRLTGRVVNNEYDPIPSATVIVKQPDKKDSIQVVTGEDGNFVFKKIKNPQIKLIVRAETYQRKEVPISFKSEEQDETIRLERRPTRVIGKVFDARTKRPLNNVRISVNGGRGISFTNTNGEFVVDDGLDPELINTFQFQKQEYKVTTTSHDIVLYKDTNIGEIYLEPMSGIVGVTEAKGSQLSTSDIEISHYSEFTPRPLDAYITDFLKQHKRFTRQQLWDFVSSKVKELSDEDINANIQELIKNHKIKEETIGSGIFVSLIYEE